jgi:hypothetical protein
MTTEPSLKCHIKCVTLRKMTKTGLGKMEYKNIWLIKKRDKRIA